MENTGQICSTDDSNVSMVALQPAVDKLKSLFAAGGLCLVRGSASLSNDKPLENPTLENPAIIGHIHITQRHPKLISFGMLLQFPMLHSWLLSSQLQTDWQRNKSMATSFLGTGAAPFPAAQQESQCCLSVASRKRFCADACGHQHLSPQLVILPYNSSCAFFRLRLLHRTGDSCHNHCHSDKLTYSSQSSLTKESCFAFCCILSTIYKTCCLQAPKAWYCWGWCVYDKGRTGTALFPQPAAQEKAREQYCCSSAKAQVVFRPCSDTFP